MCKNTFPRGEGTGVGLRGKGLDFRSKGKAVVFPPLWDSAEQND